MDCITQIYESLLLPSDLFLYFLKSILRESYSFSIHTRLKLQDNLDIYAQYFQKQYFSIPTSAKFHILDMECRTLLVCYFRIPVLFLTLPVLLECLSVQFFYSRKFLFFLLPDSTDLLRLLHQKETCLFHFFNFY